MLNEKNERELAYVVKIDAVEPIVGSDNCEAAIVGGWKIMVRKQVFKPGDLAVYFEIDSHVDTSKPEFAFLEKKHGNIKTQRYTFGGKGNFISQGLLMAPSDFGWEVYDNMGIEPEGVAYLGEGNGEKMIFNPSTKTWAGEHDFLTEYLGVTYATAEDNSRKAKSIDKYKIMAQKIGKKATKFPYNWLLKSNYGKKFLYLFYNRAIKKVEWPAWVQKTDEERVQNMPWILNDKSEWIATEKIDGTSTTFTIKRKPFGKFDFYICSRNVVFEKTDVNVYTEMAKKYYIEDAMVSIMRSPEFKNCNWITLQGETFGEGVQKRSYGLEKYPDGMKRNFMGFNFITSEGGRWNSIQARNFWKRYGVSWVPIIDEHFVMPNTVDELLEIATGESVCDYGLREGLVFRSPDGTRSFKAVSNEFILKYHS